MSDLSVCNVTSETKLYDSSNVVPDQHYQCDRERSHDVVL